MSLGQLCALLGALGGVTLALGLIAGAHPRFRRGPLPPRYWTRRR